MTASSCLWEPSFQTVTLFMKAQKIPRWLRWVPLFKSGSLDYLCSVLDQAFAGVYSVASQQATWPRVETDTNLYSAIYAEWEQCTSKPPEHVTLVLPPLVFGDYEWFLLEIALAERLPLRIGPVCTEVAQALISDLRQAVQTETLEFPVDDGFVWSVQGSLIVSMVEIDPEKASRRFDT